MFEQILEHMQRDAIQKTRAAVSQVFYNRWLSIIHHLFTFLATLLSFTCLVAAYSTADLYPEHSLLLVSSAILISGTIVLLSTQFKRQPSFLKWLFQVVQKGRIKLIRAKYTDLFFPHSIFLYLTICLPLALLLITALMTESEWVDTSSSAFISNRDPLSQVMTFSAALIAAQIALFTFIFAQFLGKYSSKIAGSLYRHRTVILLELYPILSLVILYFVYTYGCPKNIWPVIMPLFVILNLECLILTIWAANTGMHADNIITYAGRDFSNRVRKTFKPALVQPGKNVGYLWRALGFLGLDWRNPERRTLFEPAPTGVAVTISLLASLFNATHKAIKEGQQEVFVSSLSAIRQILFTYIPIRATYFGTQDRVLSFANDQMAGVIKESAKSPNESLITEAISCVGDIGTSSLAIPPTPRENERTVKQRMSSSNHSLCGHWNWLLKEAFLQSHMLMRSTAASEAINQLYRIALAAYQMEYGDVIFVGFTSAISEIHKVCILKPDAYHLTLAGNCIQKTVNVWGFVSRKYGQWAAMHDLNDQLADTIVSMATLHFKVDRMPMFNFKDVSNVLTSKLEESELILQDVFFITMTRSFTERWEQRSAVEDLKRIIKLLVNLTMCGVEQKVSGSGGFVAALYEIGYFVLRGLPPQFAPIKQPEVDRPVLYERVEPSNQQIIEEALFKAWLELFPVLMNRDTHLGLEGHQSFFAIVGLGMVVYAERGDETLKEKLIQIVTEYFDWCIRQNKNSDRGLRGDWWDYLQLFGAWCFHFLHANDLANAIASAVGRGRPFSYTIGGFIGGSSHGRYGSYGYPEGGLHSDFFLPWLRNLQPQQYLNEQDWERFKSWQEQLMKEEVLLSYFEIVEETRKPLREKFYKEMRDREERRSTD
jgi:hypothetical protein